jgi:hypothetical protein
MSLIKSRGFFAALYENLTAQRDPPGLNQSICEKVTAEKIAITRRNIL